MLCGAALFCGGCSASYHAKRALKKNPHAFKSDTTIVIDTVVVDVPEVDTVFMFKHDTVEMFVDRVKIKHHYNPVTKEVYIAADCPDQETIIKTETITETVIIEPTRWDKIKSGLFIAVVLLTIFGLIRAVRS
jgi:hypothetical protein